MDRLSRTSVTAFVNRCTYGGSRKDSGPAGKIEVEDKARDRSSEAELPGYCDSHLLVVSAGDNLSKEDRDFADDMDIGSLALKYKNYRGAELRFRHALGIKPGQPEATFKLAEAFERLGNGEDATGKMRLEEAKQVYQEYLAAQPNGQYADRARQAIEHLSHSSR
jgi:tetratricopeptide (TPR) repeat protein